jgi:hypothetical protein|tara:strand:- start:429 stop:1037 length:609 start_codon:yes stop_codon:yes gene_type:complete
MKATEMLNQVKNLLGVQLSDVQLAELKLENGTVLEADAFESGKEVFIKTEDNSVPVPVGEYELEDARVLVIEEEGMIKEIKNAEHEEDEKEDEEKVEAQYVTREEFRKEMDDLKEHIDKMMDHKDKEEMSSDVQEKVSLAVTEVLNSEAEEKEALKEELSKPAAEPLKHTPEQGKFEHKFKFAQNRKLSTLDRVMETLINKN